MEPDLAWWYHAIQFLPTHAIIHCLHPEDNLNTYWTLNIEHSFNFFTIESAYPISNFHLLFFQMKQPGPLDLVTLSTYIQWLEDCRCETVHKSAHQVSFPFISFFLLSLTCLSFKDRVVGESPSFQMHQFYWNSNTPEAFADWDFWVQNLKRTGKCANHISLSCFNNR